MSPSSLSKNRQADKRRIAFIQSAWHSDIVNQGRDAFLAELKRQGRAAHSVDLLEVPGAFELPLLAKRLAQSGHYAAVVACGFVVNGGIYRHEFVADAVVSGLMQVQLETGVPVFSVVLTPLQFHESDEHQKFFHDHFVVKGAEAARACVRTLATHQQAGELLAALAELAVGGARPAVRPASRLAKA
jgi:6,7-dimethyl-8-ribityllumazine synthase